MLISRRHFTLVVLLCLGVFTTILSLRKSEETPSLGNLPLADKVNCNVTIVEGNSRISNPEVSSVVYMSVAPSMTPTPGTSTSTTPKPSPLSRMPPHFATPFISKSSPSMYPHKSASGQLSLPSATKSSTNKQSPITKPSIKPSASPCPFTVFINQTLHGTRPVKPKQLYYDTTVNTKLFIPVPSPSQGNISNIVFNSPMHGNVSLVNSSTIQYAPEAWFTGFDTVKYTLHIQTRAGQVQQNGAFNIRVRIGVFLNKPLLYAIPANYTFSEANKRTSAISKIMITSAFAGSIPDSEAWLTRRYKTCALVGNGGSLINSSRGIEIDSHELVVRINSSPTNIYVTDVGSKMNVSFSSGPQEVACWKRNATLPFYEVVAQLTMPAQFQKYPSCIQQAKGDPVAYHALSYLFIDLVDALLNDYLRTSHPNIQEKRYRSTGFMSTIALLTVCDHLSMYGFERGPNMEHHYYPSTALREWNGHSYEAEKLFYKDLAKGTGIFENYLATYDLYTSFTYVVD